MLVRRPRRSILKLLCGIYMSRFPDIRLFHTPNLQVPHCTGSQFTERSNPRSGLKSAMFMFQSFTTNFHAVSQ